MEFKASTEATQRRNDSLELKKNDKIPNLELHENIQILKLFRATKYELHENNHKVGCVAFLP